MIMKVKVKKLNENAVIPFKTYEKDFCYDVVAVSEEEVAPNVWKYGIYLTCIEFIYCPFAVTKYHSSLPNTTSWT